MKTLSRLIVGLLILAAPALGASARFGAPVGAQVAALASAISLRSAPQTAASVSQLRDGLAAMTDPAQQAAANVLLSALAMDPSQLQARLEVTDLPEAAVARLQKISARLVGAAENDPSVSASREADAKRILNALPSYSSELADAFRQFLSWGADRSADLTPAPAAPAAAPVAADGKDWTKSDFKSLLAVRPQVAFGAAQLPAIAMPTVGDNIADLWVKAHGQSDSLLMAAYNFDDMDMAKSVIEQTKAGRKVVLVGDYSNWFPERMPQSGHGGKDAPRTEAMNYVIANLNPNLELYILKGLAGASGINHNKFSVFSRKGQKLLQSGSFNYTKTSQLNHFENVVFTDDADRIAFFTNYHGWLVRRARAFSEDLMPEEPTFPANDPIPQDASRQTYAGVPFPKQVGTPKSDAEAWLVKFLDAAKAEIMGAMFAMFPTPLEVAAIEKSLAAKLPVRIIVDRGQVSRAGALWGLIQKGMELRVIAGPEALIYHTPVNEEHSKQHMKVLGLDDGAFVKGGDSLNLSGNASNHNFENVGFHQGYVAAFLFAYIRDVMWPLASKPSQQLLDKLKAEYEKSAETAAAKKKGDAA